LFFLAFSHLKQFLFLVLLMSYKFQNFLLIIMLVFCPSAVTSNEVLVGGSHTHQKSEKRLGFQHESPVLSYEEKLDFKVGQAIFEKIWVFAPSSTTASDGLGPLYNARSCSRCHKGNGRGIIEIEKSSSPSLFLRLSIPPTTKRHHQQLTSGKIGFIPEPTYGNQLQTFAYPGGRAEGTLKVKYTEISVELSDKEEIKLQQPFYTISDLGYGSLDKSFMFSPRIAPQMIGLGLLEAIDELDLLALADPDDLNKDGISGKVNIVWNEVANNNSIGRFGWKAGSPTLEQQNNAALNGDIGISSWMFSDHAGDCTQMQSACQQQTHGNKRRDKPGVNMLEAPKTMTDLLLHYTRFIALPAARNTKETKRQKGQKIFKQAGCQKCHHAKFITAKNTEHDSLASQTIWPYTDLLLHDMGKGLADNRQEFLANGQEWRTPPLWGIGLTKLVSGDEFYLHDGRARTLLEAILWHGGEAESSKQEVINLNNAQRQQLIYFLESL